MLFQLSCLLACISIGIAEYPGPIPGPKSKNSRIIIVGGDIAGIHMAILLKKRGYTNITVYESKGELGGTSMVTKTHRGTSHEMGKFTLIPQEDAAYLNEFLNEYQLPQLQTIVEPLLRHSINDDSASFITRFIQHARLTYGNSVPEQTVRQNLIGAINQYIQRHRSLFGIYDDGLIKEPQWQIKRLLRGSFSEFLTRYNIQILAPLFESLASLNGYGTLEEMPAMYGLHLCTNATLQRTINMLNFQSTGNNQAYQFTTSSFDLKALLERAVSREQLDVHKNVRVNKIRRKMSSNIDVYLKFSNGTNMWREFDFMIWAPEARLSLKYLQPYTENEYQMFLRPKTRYMIKTLADTLDVQRSDSPIEMFPSALRHNNGSIVSSIDTINVMNRRNNIVYQLNLYPNGNDNTKVKSAVYTQFTDVPYPSAASMNAKLTQELKAMGSTSTTIIDTKIWRYFQHYTAEDLTNGIWYKILKMQGSNHMWFIGSSIWFDSIKSIFDYNEILARDL